MIYASRRSPRKHLHGVSLRDYKKSDALGLIRRRTHPKKVVSILLYKRKTKYNSWYRNLYPFKHRFVAQHPKCFTSILAVGLRKFAHKNCENFPFFERVVFFFFYSRFVFRRNSGVQYWHVTPWDRGTPDNRR